MIGRLSGELVEKDAGALLIDVNGVGYEVHVSPHVSAQLGAIGTRVSLVIYTDVRETDIVLFGFRNKVEKQTFLLLKKVKGIGSKIAMVILSSMTPERLMVAIGQGDTNSLTKVPGIGKKSAERIIVELREQVLEFVSDSEISIGEIEVSSTNGERSSTPRASEDATLALQKLGFSRDVAIQAIKKAGAHNPSVLDNVGELLKHSLAFLG